MEQSVQNAVQDFMEHHVMHHAPSPGVWNLPFFYSGTLDFFKYDTIMIGFIVLVLVLLGAMLHRKFGSVPRGLAALMEMYVLFIRDSLVYSNMGKEIGRKYVPFFCSLFLFIVVANVLGLIPLFNAVTGNISVTVGLALVFMVVALGSVVWLRGVSGFKGAFLPPGLPVVLRPMMIVLEVISFFVRVAALALRLFCNMLAGHFMIYLLLSLLLVIGWVAFPVLPVVVGMYFFELFVAILQAYIFTLLSILFINMMVNPEH